MRVGGQRHALVALPAIPIVNQAGCAPGPVWTGAESLAPTGIRTPDCPACSKFNEILSKITGNVHEDLCTYMTGHG
jgi:hypothetical protein